MVVERQNSRSQYFHNRKKKSLLSILVRHDWMHVYFPLSTVKTTIFYLISAKKYPANVGVFVSI